MFVCSCVDSFVISHFACDLWKRDQKALGPLCLVSIPEKGKDPTQGVNVTCGGVTVTQGLTPGLTEAASWSSNWEAISLSSSLDTDISKS